MNTATQADTATPVTNLPLPELEPVQSSQIFAVGYDPLTETLAIQFVSRSEDSDIRAPGSIYSYSRVPLEIAIALTQAESIGKFFGANIKGKYDFRKVS